MANTNKEGISTDLDQMLDLLFQLKFCVTKMNRINFVEKAIALLLDAAANFDMAYDLRGELKMEYTLKFAASLKPFLRVLRSMARLNIMQGSYTEDGACKLKAESLKTQIFIVAARIDEQEGKWRLSAMKASHVPKGNVQTDTIKGADTLI